MVKNLPAMHEIRVQSLDQEDPLEKGMAIHSSILAGEFHGQRSVVGYKSMGSQRVGRGHKESDMAESHTYTHILFLCLLYFV